MNAPVDAPRSERALHLVALGTIVRREVETRPPRKRNQRKESA